MFRFAFRSRSGPVPLVRVAFTPAKIDRTRSGCGPVTRSHLFRNATGTRYNLQPPPQDTSFLILVLLSSRRVTALTASRHQRRRSRIDGQIRRCMMCPNFGLQRNFGRCIVIWLTKLYTVYEIKPSQCIFLGLLQEIKLVSTSVTCFYSWYLTRKVKNDTLPPPPRTPFSHEVIKTSIFFIFNCPEYLNNIYTIISIVYTLTSYN